MPQPLSGMKVIDVTSVMAGPYCTMLLGDLGADVIKIEPPSGDMIRKSPPFIEGESTYYLYTNRNKRSITLNLQAEAGRDILLKLIEDADIFVENYRPRTKTRLKIDYPTLKEINPGLIYCSISGFGQTGPAAQHPGFDQIAQGMSGLMSVTGFPDTGPTRVGVAIGDSVASLFATYGILAAVIERHNSGRGQYLDTSLLEGLIAVLGFQAAQYFGKNEPPLPQGNDHASFAPYGTYKTKNGYINIAAATDKMWLNLCKILGLEELIEDPDFKTLPARVKNKDTLRDIIQNKLSRKTNNEWIEILNESGIACGPINRIDQVFQDEHVLQRGMLMEVEHPLAGKINTIGFPVKMKRTPCQIRFPPPYLGQHTNDILTELKYSVEEIKKLKQNDII